MGHQQRGLALLTDTKYGYRGYDDRMEVTLLRSSSRPDPLPEVGERVFRFGLAETAGETVELKKLGWRFSHRDLPYASNRAHKGTLPLDGSLMKVENALVTAVKVAEDKNGLILRLVSAKSWDCVAEVSVPGLKAALLVDLAEQTIGECSVVDGKVSLPMGAEQTKSLRLITVV
jgi:alpha-mannosidase